MITQELNPVIFHSQIKFHKNLKQTKECQQYYLRKRRGIFYKTVHLYPQTKLTSYNLWMLHSSGELL